MKRLDLIKNSVENKVDQQLEKLVNKEKRNLQKEVSDLEFVIQNKTDDLESTMSNPDSAVSKSTVLSIYAEIKRLEEQKDILTEFISVYYEG